MPFTLLAVPSSSRRQRALLLLPSFLLLLLASFLVGAASGGEAYYRSRGGLFGIGGVVQHQPRTNNNPNKQQQFCDDSDGDGEYCCWVAAADLRGGGRRESGEDDPTSVTAIDDVSGAEEQQQRDAAAATPGDEEAGSAPVVGVKSHNSNNSKKSNAVGDPDGEGSSDDDDDDDEEDLSDWDALEDVMGSMMAEDGGDDVVDEAGVMEHMHVAVEYVSEEENEGNEQEDDNDDNEEEAATGKRSRTGGGVGIRLGQRFKNHRQQQQQSKDKNGGKQHSAAAPGKNSNTLERHLLSAWQPHVYLPPPPDSTYLNRERARAVDGDGRTRLDRRTLYAGLLLEWSSPSAASSASSGSGGSVGGAHNHHHPPTTRKFLEKDTSQALQAALSLATQPAWRKSFPRPSGIRLYHSDDDEQPHAAAAAAVQGCTLAMQESIAMALVRLCVVVFVSGRQKINGLWRFVIVVIGVFVCFCRRANFFPVSTHSMHGTGAQFGCWTCNARRQYTLLDPAAALAKRIHGGGCQASGSDQIRPHLGTRGVALVRWEQRDNLGLHAIGSRSGPGRSIRRACVGKLRGNGQMGTVLAVERP